VVQVDERRKARDGCWVVIRGYFDESYKDHRVYTIGGYIGRDRDWRAVSRSVRALAWQKTMNWQPKRVVMAFVPWILASVLLYALASVQHLRLVQVFAFIATFLGVLLFALTYRSTHPGARPAPRFGLKVAAWSTILATFLYLIMTWGH
ncbi:MAG: hypothetical protein WA658_18195, partial [Candidatus Acidiferrales bacterium]